LSEQYCSDINIAMPKLNEGGNDVWSSFCKGSNQGSHGCHQQSLIYSCFTLKNRTVTT
jgi:Pyruvate/2-oxoacid:ferredoxin oxidoreductase delta subunit